MGLLDRFIRRGKEKIPGEEPMDKGFADMDKNLGYFKERLSDCDDVVFREFRVGSRQQYGFALIYVDGMIDKMLVNEEVLKTLMVESRQAKPIPGIFFNDIYDLTLKGAISAGEIEEQEYLNRALLSLLSGDTLLIIDGYRKVLVIGSKGWANRGVQEPQTETVIRGPREGFSETLRINTALVRRRLRNPDLKVKQFRLGVRSKTDLALLYMESLVNKKVLEEVKKRLDAIDLDGILESGQIEQYIEDSWLSPFPQVQNTERPDKVASALLEGRVAIVTDNTPFVLLVPVTLNILFQSAEDYYERWIISSFIRVLRYASAVIALTLPAIYISITSYHPGLIPTQLALYIAATRTGVPFPAFVEALIMEATLELLREAGIRLPGAIGQTIGIVGGLVIGQAAVEAGLVSPIMVIIVALTAISSFALPSYSMAIGLRMIRFLLMILAFILGTYGLMLGLLIILIHMCALKSFGVPYLAPFVGTEHYELQDAIIRAPMRSIRKRPGSISREDIIRAGNTEQNGRPGGGNLDEG